MKMLIECGCRVNNEDFRRYTPLHIAAENNKLLLVKFLLIELANPFKVTNNKKTPDQLSKDNIIKYLVKKARIVRI